MGCAVDLIWGCCCGAALATGLLAGGELAVRVAGVPSGAAPRERALDVGFGLSVLEPASDGLTAAAAGTEVVAGAPAGAIPRFLCDAA